jgi:polysaccharide biosynthesis transport protein
VFISELWVTLRGGLFVQHMQDGGEQWSGSEEQLDVMKYVRILLWRSPMVLAITAVVAGLMALQASTRPKVFKADTDLLIQSRVADDIGSQLSNPQGRAGDPIQTDISMLGSRPIRAAVDKKFKSKTTFTAVALSGTSVIRITVFDADPVRAAGIANEYARTFMDFRRQQAVGDLNAVNDQLVTSISGLQDQIRDVESKLITAETANIATLESTRSALLDQLRLFLSRQNSIKLDASLKTGGAQVVNPAEVPLSPTTSGWLRSLLLGLFVGGFLGCAAALALELLNDRVSDRRTVDRLRSDLPLLAMVPRVRLARGELLHELMALKDPTAPVVESYRALRTSVQFLGLDRAIRIVQFTSADQGEGKSTTVANLAAVAAAAGQRVLVICCDLRRPRLHTIFGLANDVGLTSVLLGSVSPEEAIREVWNSGEGSELHLLSAGIRPPNPSELLGSQRMKDFLDSQLERFDLILLDTPPCLPVTDPVVVAGLADTTILVMRTRVSKGRHVRRALEVLYQAGALLGGVVVIGLSPAGSYGYGKRYGEKYRYESKHSAGAKRSAGGLGVPLVLRRIFRRDSAAAGASSASMAVASVEELFVPAVGPVSPADPGAVVFPDGVVVGSPFAQDRAFENSALFVGVDQLSPNRGAIAGIQTEVPALVGASVAQDSATTEIPAGDEVSAANLSEVEALEVGPSDGDVLDEGALAATDDDDLDANQHDGVNTSDWDDDETDGEPGGGSSSGAASRGQRPTPADKRGVRNRRKHRSVRLEKLAKSVDVSAASATLVFPENPLPKGEESLGAQSLWSAAPIPGSLVTNALLDPLAAVNQVVKRLPSMEPLRPLGW